MACEYEGGCRNPARMQVYYVEVSGFLCRSAKGNGFRYVRTTADLPGHHAARPLQFVISVDVVLYA